MRKAPAKSPKPLECCTMRPRPRGPCARIVRTASCVSVCHPKKLASKSSRSPAVGTSSTAPLPKARPDRVSSRPVSSRRGFEPCVAYSIAKAPLLYSASRVPPVASSTCW